MFFTFHLLTSHRWTFLPGLGAASGADVVPVVPREFALSFSVDLGAAAAAGEDVLHFHALGFVVFDAFLDAGGGALDVVAVADVHELGVALPLFLVVHAAVAGVEELMDDGLLAGLFRDAVVLKKQLCDLDDVGSVFFLFAIAPAIPGTGVDDPGAYGARFDADFIQFFQALLPEGDEVFHGSSVVGCCDISFAITCLWAFIGLIVWSSGLRILPV